MSIPRGVYGAGILTSTVLGVKPAYGTVVLNPPRLTWHGAITEVLDHPELVIKDMNCCPLEPDRVAKEMRVLHAVLEATNGRGAVRVFNHGVDEQGRSWLVRERVFDVEPRGAQKERDALFEIVLRIHPKADVSREVPMTPKFDNIRWGYTAADPEPRWLLIDM